MSVRVELKQKHNCYTNFDFIEGRVLMSIMQQETIAAITVKLEGESRTRLAGVVQARGRNQYDGFQNEQTQLEVHKLLYSVQTVFPTHDVAQASSRLQFTLSPGQYEYPFKFKLPINNNCITNSSLLGSLSSMRMDMAQGGNPHVKKILPPSLGGLPGEAEIQYYVKATVQRPAFYKENFRAHKKFLFLPIEPKERPTPSQRESYGRRTHHFAPKIDAPEKANGLFRKPSTPGPTDGTLPPSITVEGRVPDPAVIYLDEPVPLRLLVNVTNDSPATIFLQFLHVELLGYTGIRAHELRRSEVTSWMIMSSSNMRIPLQQSKTSKDGKSLEIDPKLWNQEKLPNTVTPSFDTCNISRTYSLDIKVGLSWGEGRTINPELTVQPIRLPVSVWSGIPIPQALLDAAAGRLPPRPPTINQQQAPSQGISRPPTYVSSPGSAPQFPARPQAGAQQARPQHSQGPSDHIEPSPGDIPDEAPPSYDDAMADELVPIDGPRRDYAQQQSQGLPSAEDEKRGSGLFGRG